MSLIQTLEGDQQRTADAPRPKHNTERVKEALKRERAELQEEPRNTDALQCLLMTDGGPHAVQNLPP